MNIYLTRFILLFSIFFLSLAHGKEPLLRMSDITSGPGTGLGDSLGSGAIVTIWGNSLGSTQKNSKVFYKDSTGTEREATYVYYWKNADGKLPGGPSNLFTSHKMQEIAFSIPDAAIGNGEIYLKLDGNKQSNSLPFRVSSIGSIYWVASGGDNTAACSYQAPCEYINANINPSPQGGLADERLRAGDIVYSLGVQEPELCSGGRCSAMFTRGAVGTLSDPISFIAYPGLSSKLISKDVGLQPFASEYINLSKYAIYVGHTDPTLAPNPGNSVTSDAHIYASKGRYVGNYLGQNPGTCITGWAGAISSGGEGGEGVKFFGNEIDNIGCPNTSRFQHTTYMSVRNESSELIEAWDFSFNYLHDNYPMFGIHFYDEQHNGDCGKLNGTLRVTNNVIVNQWGAGINIISVDRSGQTNPCWAANILIENNLLINTGLGDTLEDNVVPTPIAIRIGGHLTPDTVNIFNNTIYHWGDTKTITANGFPAGIEVGFILNPTNPDIKIYNNHIVSNIEKSNQDSFVRLTHPQNNVDGKNNAFYTPDLSTSTAIAPSGWIQNHSLSEPFIYIFSSTNQASHLVNSPLINAGTGSIADISLFQTHDIYGITRTNYDIGAVEYILKPNSPSNLIIK